MALNQTFNKIKTGSKYLALTAGMAFAGQSLAIPVAVELALLVDVSGSVSSSEYNLQKGGYVDAFRDAGLQSAIASLSGGIAVSYIEWSSSNQQSALVGWTQITDATSANSFADAIEASARAFANSTAPGSAINFAVPLFNNNYEGLRNIIDVSGDGAQNDGSSTSAARDNALANGIDAINGLPILGSEANLDTWYQNNIVGGTGSFLLAANSFEDFGRAVLDKIGREINPNPVPTPGVFSLMGIALLGMYSMRNRKKA